MAHAINFLTSLKNKSLFISSDNEFYICGRKTLGNSSSTFPIGLSYLSILFGLDETKHKTYH